MQMDCDITRPIRMVISDGSECGFERVVTVSENSGYALSDRYSDVRNRDHRSNRTDYIHNTGIRRIHSNRMGNSYNRSLRTDSPTTTDSRSRR